VTLLRCDGTAAHEKRQSFKGETEMATYMVSDGDGNALTDGLQQHEAKRVAHSIANRRCESVWLSKSGSSDTGTEIEPDDLDEIEEKLK
jgi:hypothetical protein